jgi:hypothetical protein
VPDRLLPDLSPQGDRLLPYSGRGAAALDDAVDEVIERVIADGGDVFFCDPASSTSTSGSRPCSATEPTAGAGEIGQSVSSCPSPNPHPRSRARFEVGAMLSDVCMATFLPERLWRATWRLVSSTRRQSQASGRA